MFKRLFIPLLILLLLLILFKEWIESIITDYLVNFVLQYAKPGIVSDIIWVITIIALFRFVVIKRIKNYVVSNRLIIILFFATLIYLYYRLIDDAFIITGLSLNSKVAYLDLIPLFFIAYVILRLPRFVILKSKKEKEVEKYNYASFIVDQAITSKDDDRLLRQDSANELALRILSTKNEKAFAVAVTGSWGSGKTSFINLIRESILKEDKDCIVISFDPWKSHNSTSLIEDFFESLSGSLKDYSSEFNDLTKFYSQKLVDKESTITNLISLTTLNGGQNLDEIHGRINEVIRKLKRKIIVFFDDLDRLSKEEIYEVLKLIRNTADFNYVSYIATYDRRYFNNSLEGLIPNYTYTFQEKIFQIEIPLPFVEEKNLIQVLNAELALAFPEKKEMIEKKLFANGIFEEGVYTKPLNSIRAVKRFLNDFIYKYSRIKNEVEFGDFFNLVVLKMNFPFVFEDLFYNKSFYLDHFKTTDNRYSGFYPNNKNEKKSIKEYLKEKKEILLITDEQIKEIVIMLNKLFRKDLYSSKDNPLLISIPRNFETYFRLYIPKHEISEEEFNDSRKLSYEEFTKKIKIWIEANKRLSLLEKFARIKYPKDFSDKEDFEKIIKATFFIGRCNDDASVIGYPDADIYNKICDYDTKSISRKFYNSDENEYKKFLDSLFKNVEYPFIESSTIRYVFEHSGNITIPQTELKDILISYFLQMINISKQGYGNFEIYGLYNDNYFVGNKDKINALFITYLNDGFLKYFLRHILNFNQGRYDELPKEEWEYGISIIPTQIFGDYHKFKDYLKLKKEPEAVEFYEFFKKLETNSFKATQFDFKITPI